MPLRSVAMSDARPPAASLSAVRVNLHIGMPSKDIIAKPVRRYAVAASTLSARVLANSSPL